MKKLYMIHEDGSVSGLWSDTLDDLGRPKIRRASNVEYSEEAMGWVVEILLGAFAGCFIPRVFTKRSEALNAEVCLLNEELMCGRLELL